MIWPNSSAISSTLALLSTVRGYKLSNIYKYPSYSVSSMVYTKTRLAQSLPGDSTTGGCGHDAEVS